ncbi:hypothetical protein ABT097_33190, partial [Streptomyces sp. NPDC002225]|uniref:hypothetical protein n=1 Tax=Streptomyces sp. NPDC002225 TaxID=3154413 RepID=UPI003332C5FC
LSACDPVTTPDDRLVAAGRTDGRVDLYYSDKSTHTIKLADDGTVTNLTVDPNGNRIFAYLRQEKDQTKIFVIDIEAPVPTARLGIDDWDSKLVGRPQMKTGWFFSHPS